MKNIAKKIATTILAFALALVSIFTYNPLVVNATSSSDLALGFASNYEITKPYSMAISIKDNFGDTCIITEMLIQSNYKFAPILSGKTLYFNTIVNANGDLFRLDDTNSEQVGIEMLHYKKTTFSTTTGEITNVETPTVSSWNSFSIDSYVPLIVTNKYVFSSENAANEYIWNNTVSDTYHTLTHIENIPHYFDDYGAKTSSTPSSYTADASLIGEGVLVSVPAVMDLSYSEENDAYIASDYISAKGHVLDIAEVVVSTEKTAEYSLLDTNKTYEANVSFGSDMGDKNVAIWSALDLNAGVQNANNVVKKPIAISLSGGELEWAGDYKSILEVDVSYNVVGLYRDLCESSNGQIQTSDINDYASSLSNSNSLTEINLENSISRINTTTLCKGSADTTVEKIQLGSKMNSGQDFHYEGIVNTSNPLEVYSWIMGYENLQLVVVPSEVTKDTFFAGYNRFSNRHFDTTNDNGYTSTNYAGQYFAGTNIEIGNALCFVKGVTDGGYYEYVPYIVFRGTMDEWKAIPGNGDWVFGNAANTVTVQCTDGRLLYN